MNEPEHTRVSFLKKHCDTCLEEFFLKAISPSGKLFPFLMEHLSNAEIVVKSAERHCVHVQLKI